MTESQLPTVENCYYLDTSAGSGYTGSQSKTDSELKSLTSTPLGAAYREAEDSYPILAWQTGAASNIRVTSTAVTDGVVTATVTGTDYTSFINAEGDVNVSLEVPGTGDVVNITIQNATLQALASANAALTLSTSQGNVNMNGGTLTAAAAEAGTNDVLLTIKKVTSSQDYPDAAGILGSGGSVYEITLTADGANIFTESMAASVVLPYTRQGSSGSVNVKTYLVGSGTQKDLGGSYIASTNQVAFSITGELGLFGIVEEQRSTAETGNTGSTRWDGYSVDVSWYIADPDASSYSISTAAQLAGVAAIVNGLVNDDCVVWTGTRWIPAVEWNASSYVNTEENEENDGPQGNNLSTATYHYGVDDFNGQTIQITSDLDMSAGNYMPIGGQYLMSLNDYSTKLSSSFNGTFDGGGHSITIVCDRHCDTGNYGDGTSVGLIGRLGCHDGDPSSMWPTSPTVRNVAVYGSVYANRSVGGIVGKIGRTTGFTSGNNEQGGIIENCANFASVRNTDSKGCGGIVGAAWNGGVIRNCYNAGSVTSTYACPTGGIAGSNECKLENCYNVGTITAASSTFAMALGTNNGGATYDNYVVNCWYLDGSAPGGGYYTNSTANNSGALASEDMKTENFVNTLGQAFAADTSNLNSGYPVLSWQNPGQPTGTGTGSMGGNGSNEETELEIQTTTELTGSTATITVDESSLVEVAQGADSNTKLVISGDTDGDALTEVTVSMSKDGADAVVESGASLVMETGLGDLTFDSAAMESVAANSQTEIEVTLKQDSDNTMTIDVKADGQSVSAIDGKLKIALPIPEELNQMTDEQAISPNLTMVLVGEDGSETVLSKSMAEGDTMYLLLDSPGTIKMIDNSKTFSDVPEDIWYEDAAIFASSHDLFQGIGNNTFAGLRDMDRSMMVTVLHRLEGMPNASATSVFEDVPADTWYTDAVGWASSEKIVEGVSSTRFDPERSITREEIATIFYRYAQEVGLDMSVKGDLTQYADGNDVSDWASDAMVWIVGVGIIEGKPSMRLDPSAPASRSEVAIMFQRLVSLMVQ